MNRLKIKRFLFKTHRILSWFSAQLLVSFRQLPVSLLRFYHSKAHDADMLILQIAGRKLTLTISLQELIIRQDIMQHMHPFEAALLRCLAKEEQHRKACYARHTMSALTLNDSVALVRFACIEKQFFCTRLQKEMVVIELPDVDQQLCLALGDLINDNKLLTKLKSLSSYRTYYIIPTWFGQKMIQN